MDDSVAMIGRSILFMLVACSAMGCANSSRVEPLDPALPTEPVPPAEPVEGATIIVPLLPRTEFGGSVAFYDHELVGGSLTVFARPTYRFAVGDPRFPRVVVWRPTDLGSSRCFGGGTFEFTAVEGGGSGFDVQARGDELVMQGGAGEATFRVQGHFVASAPTDGVSGCSGRFPSGVFPEADVVLELALTSEVPVSAEIGGCEGAFETGDWVGVSAYPRNAEGSRLFVNVTWGRGVDLELSTDAGSLFFEPSVEAGVSTTEVRMPDVPAEVHMTTVLGGSRTINVVDASDIEFDVVPKLGAVDLIDGEVDGANPPTSLPRVSLRFENTRAGDTPLCQLSREVESLSPAVCRRSEVQGFDLVGNGLCELEWSAAGQSGVTSFEVRNVEMFGE